MKLKLFFVLLGSFVLGQNLEYVQKMNNLSSVVEAKTISDDIANGFVSKQKYYARYTDFEGNLVFLYYRADLPDDIIKEDAEKQFCQLCTKYTFKKFYKDANKDLGIKGTETYKFLTVSGKYLDLYTWWEKHFANGVTKEDLIEKKHNYRYIQDTSKGVNIRFVKNMDEWEIRNWY